MKKYYLVVDTSGIFTISDLNEKIKSLKNTYSFITHKDVLKEAKTRNWRYILEQQYTQYEKVSKKDLDIVKKKSKEIGCYDFLSKIDYYIISLAYSLKDRGIPILVSEDYYLLNLAHFLEIPFYSKKPIRYAKIFRYICPNCKKINKSPICEKCGNICKRTVIKVEKIQKKDFYYI